MNTLPLSELMWPIAMQMPMLLATLVLMGAAGWAFRRSPVAGGLLVAASLAVGLSTLASLGFRIAAPVVIDGMLELDLYNAIDGYFLATHAVTALLSAVGWALALAAALVGRTPPTE